MELFLVLGTWALVVVTFWMAYRQIDLQRQQTKDAHANLCLQNHLTFTARFDSPAFLRDRKSLAELFLANAPHDKIKESVLNFFEDMALFLRRGYLDEELAWSTFGFYAVRWWATCKGYVLGERRRQNDSTLFEDFDCSSAAHELRVS